MIRSIGFQAFLVATFLTSPAAFARVSGPSGSGGGDPCENRIQEIRNDIKSWIGQGGHKGLKLPAPLRSEVYASRMLQQIGNAKVRCVGPGNAGYPVNVRGTDKVCRFDLNLRGRNWITCERDSFQALDESEQYVLIHHEYAGLAAIEAPNKDVSQYRISNQISAYLVEHVIKKLAVKVSVENEDPHPDFAKELPQYLEGASCKGVGGNFDLYIDIVKESELSKWPLSIMIVKRVSARSFRIRHHQGFLGTLTVEDGLGHSNLVVVRTDEGNVVRFDCRKEPSTDGQTNQDEK